MRGSRCAVVCSWYWRQGGSENAEQLVCTVCRFSVHCHSHTVTGTGIQCMLLLQESLVRLWHCAAFYITHTGQHVTVHSCHFPLHFNGHFSRWTWVSRYQNVSILDIIGAEVDGGGGDNWSYKAFRVKSTPPTNHNPIFYYRPDALPIAQPTVSEHWSENSYHMIESILWAIGFISFTVSQNSSRT